MSEVENQTVAATPQSQGKKEKKIKVMNPKSKASHPPTSKMVNDAIKGLKERGGSSLQAIKKYIAANYKVDAEKISPFIRKYLKGAVTAGSLVQTKGQGASGSFKLATDVSAGGKTTITTKKRRSGAASVAEKVVKVKKSAAKRATTAKASPKKAENTAMPKTKKAVAAAAPATPKRGAAPVAAKPVAPNSAKKSMGKRAGKAGPTKKLKAPKPKTTKSPAKAKKAASLKRKK